MSDNETTADIIAKKRFDATTRDQFDSAYIVDFCDRIEAAHKREAVTDCNQFGNAEKLREALDEIRVAAMSDYEWDADYLIEKCNAALAAPPRNCDVIGNTGRALVVHGFPTKSNQWGEGEWLEFVDWLLATATEQEGVNDENK